MNINSIRGKDQQTKIVGLNPLEFLGVTYSDSGEAATLWEKTNNVWLKYEAIDGGSSYRTGGVGEAYRRKGFNFSRWYRTYDWIADDGYNKFNEWVG